jgi:hypothetical protein
MSSYFRLSVLNGRSAASIKAWLRPLEGFQPESIQRVSSLFADVAGGVHSGLLNLATNAVPATGTLTLSGFTAADTITVGSTTFGATGGILGAASTFAALGDTAVTNTGFTVLNGDLGISPGTSITGFPPGIFTGSLHQTDAVAAQAHTDATNAATALSARTPFTDITSTDLGGYTATPGNYHASSSGTWSAGPLTLNGAGDYVFVFGTSLTLPASASIVLSGGATANRVYFVTGTTFTFGANNTTFGNILAGTSITTAASTTHTGRLLVYGPSGTTITFPSAATVTVPSSSPSSNTFVVGSSDTITAANAAAAINSAESTDCLVLANSTGAVITLTSLIPGTIGNFIPISMSGGGTASGSTLSGGSEDDCIVMYNGIRLPPGTGTI